MIKLCIFLLMKRDHCPHRRRPRCDRYAQGNRQQTFFCVCVCVSRSTREAHPVMHNTSNLELARLNGKQSLRLQSILFLLRLAKMSA